MHHANSSHNIIYSHPDLEKNIEDDYGNSNNKLVVSLIVDIQPILWDRDSGTWCSTPTIHLYKSIISGCKNILPPWWAHIIMIWTYSVAYYIIFHIVCHIYPCKGWVAMTQARRRCSSLVCSHRQRASVFQSLEDWEAFGSTFGWSWASAMQWWRSWVRCLSVLLSYSSLDAFEFCWVGCWQLELGSSLWDSNHELFTWIELLREAGPPDWCRWDRAAHLGSYCQHYQEGSRDCEEWQRWARGRLLHLQLSGSKQRICLGLRTWRYTCYLTFNNYTHIDYITINVC